MKSKNDQFSKIVDNRINLCQFLQKRNAGNFVANFIIRMLKKQHDLFASCPVPTVRIEFYT